jgi:pimeloyl-ACP methyl ester carboxylesterase
VAIPLAGRIVAVADAYDAMASDRPYRAGLPREAALRTIGLWAFTPECYARRPDFIELVVQRGLTHPYPQPLHGYLRQADAVIGHDARARLPGLRVPTLVTVGSEDILTPPRFARELAALIPGARLELLPGVGHGYFWEAPDAFNAACLRFLGSLAREPA